MVFLPHVSLGAVFWLGSEKTGTARAAARVDILYLVLSIATLYHSILYVYIYIYIYRDVFIKDNSVMYAHAYLCYRCPSNFVGCDGSIQLPTSIWDERPCCTWRFMGSYKWGYKSPSMYSYPTYNPIYNSP